MPAAAVIPAPVAYIKVVAVKKLVVEPWRRLCGPPHRVHCRAGAFVRKTDVLYWVSAYRNGYFEKIRVFKAGSCSNTSAWHNRIRRRFYFVGFTIDVMINRGSRGHQYCVVRGEILGFTQD